MRMLMMVLQLQVQKGAEASLPEPAMGNMKPTSEGYKEKWQEKRAKQIEDLKDEPFYTQIEGVNWVSTGGTRLAGNFENFLEYLNGCDPFDVLVSPSPTRDIRAVACECWRLARRVPTSFPYRVFSPLRLFGAGRGAILKECTTPAAVLERLGDMVVTFGERAANFTEG